MPLNHKPILVAASLARRACLVYTQGQDNHNGHGMSPPRTHRSARNPILPVLIIVACLAAGAAVRADDVQLRPDHPERYTVVKGDTLWDIANRFLKTPWHWPRIWKINEQIKNPHLIYPGDVIVLRVVDGRPELTVLRREVMAAPGAEPGAAVPAEPPPELGTVKLLPKIYSEPLEKAIPTIPPNFIEPFLTQPLAIDEKQLEDAGYVTIGLDSRIALGNQSEFYARGLKADDQEFYQIFRKGNPIRHPDTDELLAYEAIYLGDARRLEAGDPTKLVVTLVKQEILPRDRLLAAPPRAALPYYYPRAPEARVQGRIVTALNAVAEVGPYTVVAISLGRREGMQEGHVLRVMRHVGTHKDPETREVYKLPDEESALIMVFRTFEKVSYALVMSATRPIHILDTVVTP